MNESTYNRARPLNFSTPFVQATLVLDAKDYPVEGRAIVVNTGVTDAFVAESPRKSIPALSSTTLVDTRVEQADALVLLRPSGDADMAEIVREDGWSLLGDLLGEAAPEPAGVRPFPRETPLWKSPQDEAGCVVFDPAHLLKETGSPRSRRAFLTKVNLWFAPAGTDCAIHNLHDFVEVHTQVHGLGRMQKFRAQDHSTLYEDVLMSPGYTTPDPFCRTAADGGFTYPWHQYRADTDCIWLAVEYHALPD